MWKPVRLQGVGAASSVINANTHPAGKLDDWRQRVNCLFGLGTNGSPSTWNASLRRRLVRLQYATGGPNPTRRSTGCPLEATVGWDASLNGNLAELLQEPSLMGALEGAGITVLAKGVDFHGSNPFDPTLLAGFPTEHHPVDVQQTCGAPFRTGPNPVPEQLPVQPLQHRRPEHHRQLAGRRRHLRARLGPQPADRQQPHLQQRRHALGRHQRRPG